MSCFYDIGHHDFWPNCATEFCICHMTEEVSQDITGYRWPEVTGHSWRENSV